MPRCRRYYNILHPIDPIAYRVEPLMKQEMHDKDPVQLIQVRGRTQAISTISVDFCANGRGVWMSRRTRCEVTRSVRSKKCGRP